ncbi:amidohydrolase family protein [Sphingobacterium psychroaquaticum]|uniref:Cytosine/adenosine deaminase n=1 Tax=Sphingobacterium psychroaquaticum TaxID=561061 RepID=A0A1X7K2Z3_9SPHI|nr:amidohydrolase family protein [Sphingobacterium psychroaquaticum]QBQ42580.1 amidohydrolase [Sphingobacterium psychroaquaticum]SMG35094.1 Cytosine/adenosine deaminase [Sphingobacterium psychroaquaticum]
MRYISASTVAPVVGSLIRNGVVALDDTGTIIAIYEEGDPHLDGVEVEFYAGVLIPGFVNAHCHIELSHMLGKTKRNMGLPVFLSEVMTMREESQEVILDKIAEADHMMYENGIQAVGDHVNTDHSVQVKKKSKIIYHTFVEVMGLVKEEVQNRIDRARDIEFFFEPNASITPHAPYSCSKELFKTFRKVVGTDNILSIHNQESDEENKLFRYKSGGFLKFYEKMGMNADSFKAQARNSIQSYLPYTPVSNRLILVHNTFTSLKDIDFVQRQGRDVYYCLCPKANLYIEGKLPKILNFIPSNDRIVIGTDSLASNDTLNILEELKAIAAEVSQIDFLQLLKWATINGAKALGLDAQLGSIEVGKRPGLVLLEGMEDLHLVDSVTLRRLV